MPLDPWYKVVTPREEVREGRSFNPDEFAIDLAQVVNGTAPRDYRDPVQFFSRTFFTLGPDGAHRDRTPPPLGLAGNSPVYSPGWEFHLVVAQGVAGKSGLFLPGRTVYFCPFQPGVQQDDALRLRQGLGERAGGQESGPAGGAAVPWEISEPKKPAGPGTTAAAFWNCWT